jgi:hypothetical protein
MVSPPNYKKGVELREYAELDYYRQRLLRDDLEKHNLLTNLHVAM